MIRDMRGPVLVTGGTGFIGGHLVRLLLEQGHEVRVLCRSAAAEARVPKDAQAVAGDVADANSLCSALEGCGLVFHLAANANLFDHDSAVFEQVNHQGTRNLLRAAQEAGVARVVHCSSEAVLARKTPDGPATAVTATRLEDMPGEYCRSKWLADQACFEAAAQGLDVVVAVPVVPVGPGDVNLTPPTRMLRDFCRGKIKGYVSSSLGLADVRDIAAGLLACAERGTSGRRYLLAAENRQLVDLFALLSRLTGRPAPRLRVPGQAALAFAWLEEQWCRLRRGTPLASVAGVRLAMRGTLYDGSADARELGLTYRPVDAALAEALVWLEQQGLVPPLSKKNTEDVHA
ncbi:MAG: NAD-dependent epimerase/dehydratase family protein [Desulfovibrionaceae bacterium]